MDTFAQKVDQLIATGWNIDSSREYSLWAERVSAFLTAAIDAEAAQAFSQLGGEDPATLWERYRERQNGHLEGLALRVEATGLSQAKVQPSAVRSPASIAARVTRVFLVHGHDIAVKESTARFLEKLKLEPVILHEKANEGRTVIEKFEAFADVGFAIALMTPDDVGATASAQGQLSARARQNVILELGYFTGKLGRNRVCALYKTGVEIPSDFHGVLFVELDQAGAWKAKLAQELVQAGLQIDLQGLLQS